MTLRALPAFLTSEPDEELLELFRRHATASTAFLSLYEGYRYFSMPGRLSKGVIAYIETSGAWIGAGDPVADPAEWPALLKEFRKEARARGKSVLILPASEAASKVALATGYRSIPIGAEPWHELSASSAGLRAAQEINPARQLRAKGAKVEKFRPEGIAASQSLELQEVSREWLASRKTDPLGFLNRLEPWTLSEHKQYYWVKLGDRIEAFLAAVPVWGTNGWYLVDLIRSPRAPLGATELLIIDAMLDLKKQGAERVTLGFSPLAKLEEVSKTGLGESMALRICRWLYRQGDWLYSFQSLCEYKSKFHPDRWETKYLLSAPGGLGLKEMMALSSVLYPRGTRSAMAGWLKRIERPRQISAWLEKRLSPEIVFRPLPQSTLEFCQRAKFTMFLCLLSLFLFIGSTGTDGQIRDKMLANYGFTYDRLAHAAFSIETWRSILISPVLFLSPTHLGLSLIAIGFFFGLFEVLVGSFLAFSTFLVGTCVTWPVVVTLDYTIMAHLSGAFHAKLDVIHRIGPSLGIAACYGASQYLFAGGTKRRIVLLGLLAMTAGFIAPLYWFSHFVAFGLGYFWLRALLPKSDPLFGKHG
jgi:hypothetical protein